jgi:ribonuclease Z
MLPKILRALCGLAGLLFLAIGLMFLLAPSRMAAPFAVLAEGNAGFSTLRADLSALFLGMALFALLGAIGASNRWFTAPLSFLCFMVLGRLFNLLLDGYSQAGTRALALELVLIAIFALTIASVRRSPPGGSFFGPGFGLAIGAAIMLLATLSIAFVFQREIGILLDKRIVERAFHNQLLATLPDGLHAGLCGSGSPLADPTRAGPCVFVIAGRHVYIVDAGEGSPRKMAILGLSPGLIDAILITHFHSDHIGGLGEMMLQRWGSASHKDPVPVIGPQGVESVVKGFNTAYAFDKAYRVTHHGEATMPSSGAGGVARPFTLAAGSDASQVVLQENGLTITAFAVDHGPVFPAAGYRFDYGGRSLVISGDTAPSPVLAKYSRGVDVLFHEGLQTTLLALLQDAAQRNGRLGAAKIMADIPSYHTTPEDAARLAQQAGVRELVFYHTIPALPLAYLNAAFLGDAPKIFHGPIVVGKDGTMVSMVPGGTAVTIRELL